MIINPANILSNFTHIPLQSMTGKTDFNEVSFYNPASYLKKGQYSAEVSASPYKYQIEKLNPIGISLGLPIDSSFIINPSASGIFNNLYIENCLSINAAYLFTDYLAFGIGYSYNRFEIKDLEKYETNEFSIFSMLYLSDYTSIGFGISMEKELQKETSLSGASLGIGFKNEFGFAGDISIYYNRNLPVTTLISSSLQIAEPISIKLAYRINPNSIIGGVSFDINKYLNLNYILERHYLLGFTHYISMRFVL